MANAKMDANVVLIFFTAHVLTKLNGIAEK